MSSVASRGLDIVTDESVSATLTIAAPAERVFAVLTDPTTHAAIDGTGWVQESLDPAPLTEVGQTFRMGMYHARHPDGDYQTVSRVVVLEPLRTIGWVSGGENGDGVVEFGGWVWRYDLTPLGEGQTEVTHTYDWSEVPEFIRARGIPFPPFGPDHLRNSLQHLAELVR